MHNHTLIIQYRVPCLFAAYLSSVHTNGAATAGAGVVGIFERPDAEWNEETTT